MKFQLFFILCMWIGCWSGESYVPLGYKDQQPGIIKRIGYFDPLGLSKNLNVEEFKRIQEAEVKHSRVTMLASLGLMVQEHFHPLFGLHDSNLGHSFFHYQIVKHLFPQLFWIILALVGAIEWWAFARQQNLPPLLTEVNVVEEERIPGDLGMDMFRIRRNPTEYFQWRSREIHVGRLSMLATLVIISQHILDAYF